MIRRSSAVLPVVLALAVLGGCSSAPTRPTASSPAPVAPTQGPPPPVRPADAPPGFSPADVAVDGRAAEVLGAEQVDAAARTAAQVAHIALADCHRWTTGEVDPRLESLVTPEVLARTLDELDRAGEYGGRPIPSLLSHLPDDDGNGNDQAALVREGCDDSAPLRFPHGPMRVSIAPGGEPSRLRVDCACVMTVTFGSTPVGAAQDWVFTMEQAADGWRLADVEGVVANVNWHPAPAA